MRTWGSPLHPEERYALVIANLPYPSTLQLNRWYTVEFFQMVRDLLAEEGILVSRCPGTLTYMSGELRDLNAMAYRTLETSLLAATVKLCSLLLVVALAPAPETILQNLKHRVRCRVCCGRSSGTFPPQRHARERRGGNA